MATSEEDIRRKAQMDRLRAAPPSPAGIYPEQAQFIKEARAMGDQFRPYQFVPLAERLMARTAHGVTSELTFGHSAAIGGVSDRVDELLNKPGFDLTDLGEIGGHIFGGIPLALATEGLGSMAAASMAERIAPRAPAAARVLMGLAGEAPEKASFGVRLLARAGHDAYAGMLYGATSGSLYKLADGQSRIRQIAIQTGLGAAISFGLGMVLGVRGARAQALIDRLKTSNVDIDREVAAGMEDAVSRLGAEQAAGEPVRTPLRQQTLERLQGAQTTRELFNRLDQAAQRGELDPDIVAQYKARMAAGRSGPGDLEQMLHDQVANDPLAGLRSDVGGAMPGPGELPVPEQPSGQEILRRELVNPADALRADVAEAMPGVGAGRGLPAGPPEFEPARFRGRGDVFDMGTLRYGPELEDVGATPRALLAPQAGGPRLMGGETVGEAEASRMAEDVTQQRSLPFLSRRVEATPEAAPAVPEPPPPAAAPPPEPPQAAPAGAEALRANTAVEAPAEPAAPEAIRAPEAAAPEVPKVRSKKLQAVIDNVAAATNMRDAFAAASDLHAVGATGPDAELAAEFIQRRLQELGLSGNGGGGGAPGQSPFAEAPAPQAASAAAPAGKLTLEQEALARQLARSRVPGQSDTSEQMAVATVLQRQPKEVRARIIQRADDITASDYDEMTGRWKRSRTADRLRAAREREKAARAEAETERRTAQTDELSGLLNKRGDAEQNSRVLQKIQDARASGENVAAVRASGDINGFKQINDVLGHEEGDKALKAAGDALTTALRDANVEVPTGKAARAGGDEFKALAAMEPGTDLGPIQRRVEAAVTKALRPWAERIRAKGQEPDPMSLSMVFREVPPGETDLARVDAGMHEDLMAAKKAAGSTGVEGRKARAAAAAGGEFPLAGETVGGLKVGSDVPELEQIRQRIGPHELLPGTREVPLSVFGDIEAKWGSEDPEGVAKLVQQIKESGRMDPVVMGQGPDGDYVVNGVHRLLAAKQLGMESVPAAVLKPEGDAATVMRGLFLGAQRAKAEAIDYTKAAQASGADPQMPGTYRRPSGLTPEDAIPRPDDPVPEIVRKLGFTRNPQPIQGAVDQKYIPTLDMAVGEVQDGQRAIEQAQAAFEKAKPGSKVAQKAAAAAREAATIRDAKLTEIGDTYGTDVEDLIRTHMGLDPVDMEPTLLEQATAMRHADEGARAYSPSDPVAEVKGNPTVVSTPSGPLAAHYSIIESDALQASHNPGSWQPNPDYFPAGAVQGRDYMAHPANRESVVEIATKPDIPAFLDPTQYAQTGPPVVTPDGKALAGNGRSMALELMRENNPAAFDAYRSELARRAETLGFDPAKVEGMKNPVLVRVLEDPSLDFGNIDQMRELNIAFDQSVGKVKTALEDAGSRAARLERSGDAAMQHLEETLDPDQTLRAWLWTKPGVEFVKLLRQGGIITTEEAGHFIDQQTGMLTEAGKDMIQKTLLVRAVGDAGIVERTPKSIQEAVEHAIPGVIRSQGSGGWDLSGVLREAFEIHGKLANEGAFTGRTGKVWAFRGQQDMFGAENSARSLDLAQTIEDASKADITSKFRAFFREMDLAMKQGQSDDLFGFEPKTPEKAFDENFGAQRRMKESGKKPCP